jgi:hypothetical protein
LDYLEQDNKFDTSSTRPFGFVDSKFNGVYFDSFVFRTPLFSVASFEYLTKEVVDVEKLTIFVNETTYWNIVFSTLTHIVDNIFRIDRKNVLDLYKAYQLKHFKETGLGSPSVDGCVVIDLPEYLLPNTFSDCGFELLAYYFSITAKLPLDENFGKKINIIMEKWLNDRLASCVTLLLRYGDVFENQNSDMFVILSLLVRNQPIAKKQAIEVLMKYYDIASVVGFSDEKPEIEFLIRFLRGEVSVVDCFEYLTYNKIKAFSLERDKINEWVLYKCFAKKL